VELPFQEHIAAESFFDCRPLGMGAGYGDPADAVANQLDRLRQLNAKSGQVPANPLAQGVDVRCQR
jgi:hypothetical protein